MNSAGDSCGSVLAATADDTDVFIVDAGDDREVSTSLVVDACDMLE
jgi:hypothetical protein